jgi:CxxC-x17-CxxC domain-containing protein
MEEQELQDQLLVCVDCGAQFTFTGKEQAFYKERGFMAPRRCRACRDKRKAATAGGPPGFGHFPPPHYAHSAAGPGAPAGAPADRPARPHFKVICAACGVETTVPFKPDPNRPAYCRRCYVGRRRGPGAPPSPAAPPLPQEPERPAMQ